MDGLRFTPGFTEIGGDGFVDLTKYVRSCDGPAAHYGYGAWPGSAPGMNPTLG